MNKGKGQVTEQALQHFHYENISFPWEGRAVGCPDGVTFLLAT